MELIAVFFSFFHMYETVNGYKYFRILLYFGNHRSKANVCIVQVVNH